MIAPEGPHWRPLGTQLQVHIVVTNFETKGSALIERRVGGHVEPSSTIYPLGNAGLTEEAWSLDKEVTVFSADGHDVGAEGGGAVVEGTNSACELRELRHECVKERLWA